MMTPLGDAVPHLPQFPIGINSTNGTIPVPGFGDLPAPFDILALVTFCQTTFTLVASWYIAWQGLTAQLRTNERSGLDLIATLDNRVHPLITMEKEKGGPTPQTMALACAYQKLVSQIHDINDQPFLQRWLMASKITEQLRTLSTEGENIYQLYLLKVNASISVNSEHTNIRVMRLEDKVNKLLQLLGEKSGC